MADYLVGCDVGTGGTKAVVIATDGTVLGSHFVEYPLITAKDPEDRFRGAKAEQDPEWYWQAVTETVSVSIRQARIDPKDIKGVGVSGLSPICIPVNKELRPLSNAHIWLDRRATEECDWLRREIGEDRIFRITGNVIDPFYGTPKVMWIKNHRPEIYAAAHCFLTSPGYIVMRLTGKTTIDHSNASLYGMAYNLIERQWDQQLVEEVGLDPKMLPHSFACDEVVGEVTREASTQTGLPAGTPVVAGTVDANASWLAAGAVDPGAAHIMLGTSGVLGVVHRSNKFTRGLIVNVHAANPRCLYTTAGATANCGSLLRYLRDQFGECERAQEGATGRSAYDQLCHEASQAPPGSDGLIVLPYFMGERTPMWDPNARGVVFGLTLHHTRGHWVRAFLEATAYALRQNYEIMSSSGLPMNLPIILGEGGARSPLWRQIMADVLNVECAYSPCSKGAPFADAVIAGIGVGIYRNYDVIKKAVQTGEVSVPDPVSHSRYMDYYNVFRGLYPALKAQFVKLAEARQQ